MILGRMIPDSTMKKTCISADQLLRDSFALALLVLRSGYRPDLIVGVWRGGTPVGIAVHEAFDFTGNGCDHLSIRTTSYTGINQRQSVQVEGLDYLLHKVQGKQRLLLVDDVFDSGQSMARLIEELHLMCGSQPPEIRIAVPWYKPTQNTTKRLPDYYLHETSAWLVFPHELCGLQDAELLQKPGLDDLAAQLLQLRDQAPASGPSQGRPH
jgi:hypoxanthine phosphoribosyltransferase